MSESSSQSFDVADSLSRMDARRPEDRWLTPASVGISVALVAAFAYFLPYLYLRLNLRAMAGGYLPVIAVFPLLLLLALNAVVRRLGIGLRRGELTVIFCTLMVSLSTLMTIAMLYTSLPSPVNSATASNRFRELFLWSIDERLLPYSIEDKEREKSAGQFEENINWYYMGVPEPLKTAPETSGSSTKTAPPRTTAPARTTAPPSVASGGSAYDASKLRIPWWRWVRRHGVDREERIAAYAEMARQIRSARGLEPEIARRMLAEVAVLQKHVDAIHVPVRLAYHEIARQDAYAVLIEQLGEAKKLRAAEMRELADLIKTEQETDSRIPRRRWSVEYARQRQAAYERLARRIRNTDRLEPEIRREMLAQIEILRQPEGAQQTAYILLLKELEEARIRGQAGRAALAEAIERERRADARLPRERWTKADRARRIAAYKDLAGRIHDVKEMPPESTQRMLELVAMLQWPAASQDATYAGMLARIDAEETLDESARRSLKAAVLRERAADAKVPWWRWDAAFRAARLKAYDALAQQIAGTEELESRVVAALTEEIGSLRNRVRAATPPDAAYATMARLVREADDLSTREYARLRSVLEKEQQTDLELPWWRWPPERAGDRERAYVRLGRLIASARTLGSRRARGMLVRVQDLRQTMATVTSPAAAYSKLLRLLDESRGLSAADRQALAERFRREQEKDRHIATYLEVPRERKYIDRPWFGLTGPLVWWSVLMVLFVVCQFCIAALLRRQWVDHEKLLFPHVEILEATTEPGAAGTPGGGIVRNRLFWVGFVVAVLMFLQEGVNHYWQQFPGVQFKEFNLSDVLTDAPWNAIPAALDFHVFVIAIAFLLPAEISFSVWAFVLVDFAVRVYLRATGETYHVYEPIEGYLINGGADQLAGLTLFVAVILFGGRRHFAAVLRKAFGRGKDVDDSEEPLPYFGAFWGMVLSFVGIIVWCYIMGMSPILSLWLFGLTLVGIVFLSRLVCELGIVTGSFQDPTMPQYLLAGTFGYRTQVGVPTLWNRMMFMTPTYGTWGFLWPGLFYGVHVMPMVMTSERMFRHGPSRRRFTGFLLLLTVAVMIVFSMRSISIPYREGAINLRQGRHNKAGHTFNNCLARDFIRKERMHKPFKPLWLTAVVGMVVMGVLLTLRHLFYWWPLHPIGYICAGLGAGVWFSVFLGWFLKRLSLKYGGGRFFRTLIPLFVGLLVGHFVMAGVWLIVGTAFWAVEQEGLYSAIWCDPSYGR